jgi:hypothetical protein
MKVTIYKRLMSSPTGVDTNHRSGCGTVCPFGFPHMPKLGNSWSDASFSALGLGATPNTVTELRMLLQPVKAQGCTVGPVAILTAALGYP